MIDLENEGLILYTDEEHPPAGLICERRGGLNAVRRSLPNLIRLAAAGCTVPDPMARYDWPSAPGASPFETQKRVASFMVLHPRSFVLSDMRTGKTRAALWAMDYLMARSKERVRALVVSDLNALRGTWLPEISTHLLGRRKGVLLHGDAAKREKLLEEDCDIYLINHEGLSIGFSSTKPYGLAKSFLSRNDIKLICFDEATTYKNRLSVRHKAATNLFSKRASFVWAMTGTPTAESAMDAFGIKKLVHPNVNMTYKAWQDKVSYPVSAFKRQPRSTAVDDVAELLSPAIRISQSEVFTATEVKYHTLRVPLTNEQKKYIKELKKNLVLLLGDDNVIDAVNEAALRIKLLQIVTGAVYDSERNVVGIDASARLNAYKKLVDSSKNKIITFAPFIHTVSLLNKELGETSIAIHKDMNSKERREVVKHYVESPNIKTLISHPSPIARGIDLSCASVIIWYAPVDRTELYIQGNERINGINQTKARHIIRIASSPIEEDIYDKLENNESMLRVMLKLKEMNV
jgi:SNF2 family DNA or RNA helicase